MREFYALLFPLAASPPSMPVGGGACGGFREAAEELIIDEFGDGGAVSAHGAGRVASDLERSELRFERVVHQQLADEGFAEAHDELGRFRRLNGAHGAAQRAEHARVLAGGHHTGGRRFGIEAAVAGSALTGVVDGRLALELEDGGVDDGFSEKYRCVVHEIAGGEIVRPVDDDVVVLQEVERVVAVDSLLVRDDVHVRVQRGEGGPCAFDLGGAHAIVRVDDLAL